MSYDTSIPQGPDPLVQSQAQIRGNFQAINTIWADNHFILTGPNVNQGMHNVLTLRPQSADPIMDATHVALYCKAGNLFFAPNNAQTPIQLTYPSISTSSADPIPLRQYTFMAGPFVIYGGLIKRPNNMQMFTLSPTSTLLYVGLVTTNPDFSNPTVPQSAVATNIVGSTFKVQYSANGTNALDVYYLAIGK